MKKLTILIPAGKDTKIKALESIKNPIVKNSSETLLEPPPISSFRTNALNG